MEHSFGLIALGVGGLVLCVVGLLAADGTLFERRVRRRFAQKPVERVEVPPLDGASVHIADQASDGWAFLLPRRAADVEQLRMRLTKAGFKSSSAMATFFVLRLLAMVVPVVAAAILAKLWSLDPLRAATAGMSLAAFGYMLPTVMLQRRVSRRKEDIVAGIPDFLDLTVVCLQGGLSLAATLQRVTEELALARPSLGRELEIVQRDVALGTPLERAFRNFADRTEIEQIRTLASFIRESMRFGSELVAPFADLSELIRFQREQLAEEQAQKASVKVLFPMLLLILPAVFVVLVGPAAIQIHETFIRR